MSEILQKDYKDIEKKLKKSASDSQREASNPFISAWVEASAGTGKTQVLSDRVLRLLLNDADPGRILCLTYTKAAAAEMRNRISERLSNWSVQSNEEVKEKIKDLLGEKNASEKILSEYVEKAKTLFAKLLDTPGGMKIRTIHAFCTEVLRRFPLEAGISPYFEVMLDREVAEALKNIQDEILRESRYSDSEESRALIYLTENIKEASFPVVMNDITENHAKIARSINKFGGFEGMLAEMRKRTGIAEDDTREKIEAEAMKQIDKSELKADIEALKHGCPTSKRTAELLEQILLKGCLPEDYNEYFRCFFGVNGDVFADGTLACKKAAEYDSDLLTRRKNEAERLQQVKNKCKRLRVYNSSKAFLTIAQSINNKYEEYKSTRSRLDFADLVNKVCNLLSNPTEADWVLYKLDGGIDHILLDEAQDTSPQQWNIIKALSEEFFNMEPEINRTVFVVGDRKQSIYSFQGADLQQFDKMAKYFKTHGGANFKNVDMKYSFRSAPAVLESVNTVFANEDAAKGVISPDTPVDHIAIRAGEFGKVEVWPVLVSEDKGGVTPEDKRKPPVEMRRKPSILTELSLRIVEEIKRMMIESEKTDRPLHYKDFMVLVRRRNNFVNEFIRACKKKHVNIAGADKMVLSAQIAVQDLISLGKFLLLPSDDLSLAEVLKSPLFGLTDADLENLCCERGKSSLWSSLAASEQYHDAHEELTNLIGMLDFIRPFELFNHVLVNMGGRRKFLQRMGVEAEDAIDEFMNLTLAYERTQTPSLQGFITWFERDETAISREGENDELDAVRLMTVHHSKGLQARVVFLPDTVQLPSNNNEQKLLIDGEGLAYYPLCSNDYDDMFKKINEENGISQLEEYRRQLYVALTRAEDRLIICGYEGKRPAKGRSWMDICKDTMGNKYEADKNNVITHETPEFKKTEVKKKYFVPPLIEDPADWISVPAEKESPMAKPYTPSKPESEEEEKEPDSVSPLENGANYYRRGSLIHKILQFLPADSSDKAQIIDEYMKRNVADFSDEEKKQIKEEILNLLIDKEYEMIFGADSRAEVPVFGAVDGKIISGQIDRLVIQKDKITIVDFKTNRPAGKTLAETPEVYKKQLKTYEALIRKIYPDRNVESYILWTNEARLMRVS